MSNHKTPLTKLEKDGLIAHGLGRHIGKPSQLADVFRQGVAWALAHHPAPTHQPVLVRDLAEILGATVPEVCDALAECGGPRLSTNMAVSGEEALAVAAKLKQAAELQPTQQPLTELVEYILQDDIHNRLTPRVIDIAYSAWSFGRSGKNKDDGGPCDWFNDTKPMVTEQLQKIRKDLLAEAANGITGSKT